MVQRVEQQAGGKNTWPVKCDTEAVGGERGREGGDPGLYITPTAKISANESLAPGSPPLIKALYISGHLTDLINHRGLEMSPQVNTSDTGLQCFSCWMLICKV